jgi:hypothetical protein
VAGSDDPRGCVHRGPGRGQFALEADYPADKRSRGCTPRSMASVWAYIVSGAAQARTAAPTPPFGRTRILAILRRAGKVTLVGLLPQSDHESDTRHRGDDNCCKSQQQCMTILFLRRDPLLPYASVLGLPSIATDRVQFARNTQGDRDGNECGSFDEAHDKAASATGNGAARRQHDL